LFLPAADNWGDARHGVDLHLDSTPQDRLHGGARRSHSRKELRVNRIEPLEVMNIAQVAGALHDVVKRAACGFQDFTDVREGQPGLVLDAAFDDIPCFQVKRALAADVEPPIDQHSSGVRTRRDFLFRMLYFNFASCSQEPPLSHRQERQGFRGVFRPAVFTSALRHRCGSLFTPKRNQQSASQDHYSAHNRDGPQSLAKP